LTKLSAAASSRPVYAPPSSSPRPGGVPDSELPALEELDKALAEFVERGRAGKLDRALRRALDAEGVPRAWPVSVWPEVLARLARARLARPPGWPASVDAHIEGLVRALLRFSRPDGSTSFGPQEGATHGSAVLQFWADRLADTRLKRVVDDWFGGHTGNGKPRGSPPLPAFACGDRPLAVLRENWSRAGDWLSIDHRTPEPHSLVELAGLGNVWLGPEWDSGLKDPLRRRPRPTRWKTGPNADLAEWTFETPRGRVSRSAVLLRGRQLALLADEVRSNQPEAAMRIAIAPGVDAQTPADSRALRLSAGRARAQILPLALPALPYPTDRGSLEVRDGFLFVRQQNPGKRCWIPLLVSWNPERNRKPVRWRMLTVTDRSKILDPHIAFAVRVWWGRESLVIYRSLARPVRRAFLGHLTSASFLVGLFTKKGEVKPLITTGEDEE
jgi:hypothetical protein